MVESFGGEAARALREVAEADGIDADEEIGVDLLWGLAFRAGTADSPVNRLARWERSLQLQLQPVMAELERRRDARRAARRAAQATRAEKERREQHLRALFGDDEDDEDEAAWDESDDGGTAHAPPPAPAAPPFSPDGGGPAADAGVTPMRRSSRGLPPRRTWPPGLDCRRGMTMPPGSRSTR